MNRQTSATGRCFVSRWGVQRGYKSAPVPESLIPSLPLRCTSISGKSGDAAGLWGSAQPSKLSGRRMGLEQAEPRALYWVGACSVGACEQGGGVRRERRGCRKTAERFGLGGRLWGAVLLLPGARWLHFGKPAVVSLPSCSGCSQRLWLWLWWDNPAGGIRSWCKV